MAGTEPENTPALPFEAALEVVAFAYPTDAHNDKHLRADVAARALGVSARTLRRWAADGRIRRDWTKLGSLRYRLQRARARRVSPRSQRRRPEGHSQRLRARFTPLTPFRDRALILQVDINGVDDDTPQKPPVFLTPREAADEFGVSTRTLARWVKQRWIRRYATPTARVRYSRRDINRIIKLRRRRRLRSRG